MPGLNALERCNRTSKHSRLRNRLLLRREDICKHLAACRILKGIKPTECTCRIRAGIHDTEKLTKGFSFTCGD